MQYKPRPDMPVPLMRALEDTDRLYREDLEEHLKNAPEHDVQFSITTLTNAPRQLQLMRRHSRDMVVDALKENWFKLQGNIIHWVLQEYGTDDRFIVERRVGKVIHLNDKKVYIHGQFDLFDTATGELTDWKYLSGLAAVYEKPEYIFQLNGLRWLAYQNEHFPHRIAELQNILLFRHIDKSKFRIEGYPRENAVWFPVEKWSREKIEREIHSRAAFHLASMDLPDNVLPECTDGERWIRHNQYKLYKKLKDGSRWSKTSCAHGSEEDIAKYASEHKLYYVLPTEDDPETVLPETKTKLIKGKPIRCLDYCLAAPCCNQHQQWLQDNPQYIKEDNERNNSQ